MLKTMRRHTKVIIWVVVLSFILWGGVSVGTSFQKKGRVAGEIFGRDVTFQEFNRFYRASQIFRIGDDAPNDPEILRQRTWYNLILAKEAKRVGIKVSDDEIRNEVLRLLANEQVESPSLEFYRNWLQRTLRETPQEFEKKIRDVLLIQKLLAQVNEGVVEPASTETLRERFILEHATVSATAHFFDTKEQASTFADISSAEENDAVDTKKYASETLLKLMQELTLSVPQVTALWNANNGDRLGPFETGTQSIVLELTDKKPLDENLFNDDLKKQYAAEYEQQQKLQRFFMWNQDLQGRSQLKDYLPSSEQNS